MTDLTLIDPFPCQFPSFLPSPYLSSLSPLNCLPYRHRLFGRIVHWIIGRRYIIGSSRRIALALLHLWVHLHWQPGTRIRSKQVNGIRMSESPAPPKLPLRPRAHRIPLYPQSRLILQRPLRNVPCKAYEPQREQHPWVTGS